VWVTDYVRIVEETRFMYRRRRILKIKPSIVEMGLEDDDNDCELITKIVDASGLTISKKGEYIEEKWIRKKRFVKLHTAADAKSIESKLFLFE
jgi:hypothetical protein